jgi:riboflavin biosynthesis pyrimidine reductase
VDARGSEAIGDVDVHDYYAAGWAGTGGVRVNFVTSVDGAATVAGRSRGLQTPGDMRVFAALRDLADIVLVGAATAGAEQYGPVKPSPERAEIRRRYGISPQPAIGVVSASLDLDLDAALFADPDSPTIVITASSAPISRLKDIIDAAAGSANLQLLEAPSSGAGVEMRSAMNQLAAAGYRHILCEGGPRLFSSILLAGAADELCLTLSPMLAGPGNYRLVGGPGWPEDFLPQMTLTGLLTEDDALFCRYAIQH